MYLKILSTFLGAKTFNKENSEIELQVPHIWKRRGEGFCKITTECFLFAFNKRTGIISAILNSIQKV